MLLPCWNHFFCYAVKILTINDFCTVVDATFEARGKWRQLGDRLLSHHEVENIEGDNAKCLRAVLSVWLKNRKRSPTWAKLLAALRHKTVGEEGVADDIVKTYFGEFDGD